MRFNDVIGQKVYAHKLAIMAKEGRIPHALMLHGTEGCGKLPLALAFAQYLACENPLDEEPCGTCPSCRQMERLAHPDVYFIFPVVKKKSGRDAVSDDFLSQWRQILLENPYLTLPKWLDAIEAGNARAQIYAAESTEMQRKLSLRPGKKGWRILLMWLPEKMNPECANKMLKLLEEPPGQTLFLLVCQEPEELLPTIRSRVQAMNIRPPQTEDIATWLANRYMLEENEARKLAGRAGGNIAKALESLKTAGEETEFFEFFTMLMRAAYARKVKSLKEWSEKIAAWGREKQSRFLCYCQEMIRDSFVHNFKRPELVYLNTREKAFTDRFAPFVNEKNIAGLTQELEDAETHILRNVAPKMVLFDLALKMTRLIRNA